MARPEIDARVLRTAESLDLSAFRRPRARIVRAPRAFLFDEPLSNLDPRLRGETRAEPRNGARHGPHSIVGWAADRKAGYAGLRASAA